MKRRNILETANALITGDRAEAYGDASISFAQMAKIWGAILGIEVSSIQVALCMAGLKIIRAENNPEHMDSWVDIAGYAALGGELAERMLAV